MTIAAPPNPKMTTSEPIQIITVYSATATPKSRLRLRVLGLVSLLAASFWLAQCLYPGQLLGQWSTVHSWIKTKVLMANLNAMAEAMGPASDNPWVALGLAPPPNRPAAPKMSIKEMQQLQHGAQNRSATLWAEFYVWQGANALAGAWLLLASLFGLAAKRVTLRLHKQAAWLMIFASLVTVAAIFVAIRFGGMPPQADATLYAKIFATQSAYAWFLLITTRLLR